MNWQTIVLQSLSTLIAAIPGIIALWQIRDRYRSYLHIDVRTDVGPGDFVTATTVVENHSITKKKLDNALLLIGPENESPLVTMREIGLPVRYTNDIVEQRIESMISKPGGRFLIPIDFYYSENIYRGRKNVVQNTGRYTEYEKRNSLLRSFLHRYSGATSSFYAGLFHSSDRR